MTTRRWTATGCRRWGTRPPPRRCDRRFRVHLDGYDFLPYLTGDADRGPRTEFFYFSDDGDLVAMRYDNWKVVFMEQRMPGTVSVGLEPLVVLRAPKLFNLRTDPCERADTTSDTLDLDARRLLATSRGPA